MFEGGTVETEMYDAILGSARFLRRCIEDDLYHGAFRHFGYLFSGLIMTPSEIRDILLCYSRYSFFLDIIIPYDEYYAISVDFRPEDIIEHQEEISEIHPGIVKVAEAVHGVDWPKVAKENLVSLIEITQDTEITVSALVHSECSDSEKYICSTYGPPHIKACITPGFFYWEHESGNIYPREKNYMMYMLSQHSSDDLLNNFVDTISTKDLHHILEIFAGHGTSVSIDSGKVKLERPMGPKSARSAKHVPG